jgi:hypothetical protein
MAWPIFMGYIENGVLYLEKDWKYNELVKKLEGQQVELQLRKRRMVRTNQQNRYLHGVVIPILAEHLGYDHIEMKDALKWRFLQTHQDKLPTVRSTAELSTAEMTEFIEQIRRLAAELGCDIPSPGEAAES